jgi:hypothetical protein
LPSIRKKKAGHKTTTIDDKRLQITLKRIAVNVIPGIEEVNIFMEDTVVQFNRPKGNSRLICGECIKCFCSFSSSGSFC